MAQAKAYLDAEQIET